MATDGVKVIDGDLAHDVYYTFMDMYDAGKPLSEIQATVEQLQAGNNDDFDDEIFITVYALALWEIGALSPEILVQVQHAIEQDAFARYLTQEEGQSGEARSRQQMLEQFWQKINRPNACIRKHEATKPPKKPVFNTDDVLTFQLIPDGVYCITVLLSISQGRYSGYNFILHTYTGATKPTMDDVMKGKVLAHPAVPGSISERIAFTAIGITHKDLLACADRFECIGRLDINEQARRLGCQSGATCFASFTSGFRYLERGSLPYRARKYSIRNLL
ncbi:hypothetical protein [Hymenobacter lucidus]|uniref:Uncharacterized protein n=1 Tax=Hymenobacter lucidus TaxID=2880930 RepID=A0ABS8AUJ7_9BACT|nr:hypothetical protein [Hymenobacter lucidus]MCB2409880.1 hypothetical protein [Hymenobacter lucidus]